MKTVLFFGITVAVVVVVARQIRKWGRERVTMEELDQILTEILGDCLEAYCEDCDGILAQGTGQYKDDVFTAAFNHGEIYDHEVKVRSWAD